MTSAPAPDAERSIRDQLIEAAAQHFSQYGYAKTTLAELAREVGFSKSYIYRFFASKQEIGEAICTITLRKITDAIARDALTAASPMEKLRKTIRIIATVGADTFFQDRKLYDLSAASGDENWASSQAYRATIAATIRAILVEGREAGEFERKTPLDETVRAIVLAISPFMDPRALQHNLDLVPDGVGELTGLVLRSLAP
jgi:AcrR family transcriptional regulator